jgi:GNAT superfamily N-acetyltransferase
MGMRDDSGVTATLDFRAQAADAPPASDLIEAMVQEVAGLYGSRLDVPGKPTAHPEQLRPEAGGICLVGWAGERAVAVGAVKRLGDGVCEIKRMYVAHEARGAGVARALLTALEDAARSLGYERVRLDTGPSQPHAKALYLSAGYVEIPDYNGNPDASFWAEKPLR